MTLSLCLGLVHIAAFLHLLCTAWAQDASPLRIHYASSNRHPQYDCLSTHQFVKLGDPSPESNSLVLCDSQDIRLSFSPLSEKTNCWHRCTVFDIVSGETESWVQEVANTVKREVEERVGLKWPMQPVFIADDSQNDVLEDSSEASRAPICPAIPSPFSEALPEHSLTAEDIRVYVTVRPNPTATRGVTSICRRDRFGRPAIAHINIHAPFAKAQYTRAQTRDGASARQQMHVTLLHETMHALALTSESLQQFRAPSRRLWGSVVEDADVRGVEAKFLVTPNVAFEVRQQYRIEPPLDTADSAQRTGGLEILGYRDSTSGPQQEAPVSDEIHVSPQVARNDVSAPSYDVNSVISNISLAILDDSGWYITNRSLADRLTWGQGQGRDLLQTVPSQAGDANSTVSAYNCDPVTDEPRRVACSFDPAYKGFCISADGVGDLAATAFSSYVAPVRELGSCKTGPDNALFNGSRIIAEQIGNSSMCFEMNGGGRAQVAVCLLYECVPDGVNFSVGSQEYFCPFGNTSNINVELSTRTQPYGVACPSMQAACPHMLPDLQCPGDCNYPFGGMCKGENTSYQCSCNEGWSGDDCSVYSCTGDSCPAATASTAVPDSSGAVSMGMCVDGECECAESFTGVDCRLPEPTCLRDCALLGQGYHCVGDVCERQCSTDGRSCMPVEDLQEEVEECARAFAFAKTTHVCVPPVNTGAQVVTLREKLIREKSRWRPIDPSNPAADSQECALAQEILACFSVFRECTRGTDVELPLCLESCKSYGRNCGVELSEGLCIEPTFRNTRDSSLCSGSANPKDYLTRAQKFGIIFGAIIAFLLILLLILLWLYRCGPCSRQEVPPIPPRMRELTDMGDEDEAEGSVAGSGSGLPMAAVQVQEPPPLCGLSRRRWHGSGRFAQPGVAAAAYAHDVGSTPGRSVVGPEHVPTPPLSHMDSKVSGPDTGDAVSSFLSQRQSGGPETPPVSGVVPSPAIAAAAHAAAAAGTVGLQPVSYGAHTTMQPQLLASAFSAADDPPLLQQSWQQDALWKGDKASRPPPPPHEDLHSGTSSDGPTPQRSRSPLSRHATNHASSPFASRLMSAEASAVNSQQTHSFEGPPGTAADGPSGRFLVHGTSSLSSRQLAALSGSVMLHTKPKSRAPGSRMIRKRPATASSAAQHSSGTAPSAQNETDLERIACMLSLGASSRARSPEPTSEVAPEGTGRRSPLANVSTNLDVEPIVQPPAIIKSHLGPRAQSHSSTHEASPNDSRLSSSRRSGDVSPLRTSTHGSAGVPARSPSPPEASMRRYPGSRPRSRDAISGAAGTVVGPAAVGATALHAQVATHFGPETDLQLSSAPRPYQDGTMGPQKADTAAPCSDVEARVLDHNAALGYFPPPEDTQDPFLDETVEERAPEEARQVSSVYGQAAHLSSVQLNSVARDGTASITLQLPSFRNRTLQPGQAGGTSFRRGFASVGSLSLTGRHRNESVPTLPLERHVSDPFLTDTVNLDEDTGGPSDRFKEAESSALSHGGHFVYHAGPTPLHQVSEISEPRDSGSLSVGGTGTIPVANRQPSQSSSELTGASDPFLSESQA